MISYDSEFETRIFFRVAVIQPFNLDVTWSKLYCFLDVEHFSHAAKKFSSDQARNCVMIRVLETLPFLCKVDIETQIKKISFMLKL